MKTPHDQPAEVREQRGITRRKLLLGSAAVLAISNAAGAAIADIATFETKEALQALERDALTAAEAGDMELAKSLWRKISLRDEAAGRYEEGARSAGNGGDIKRAQALWRKISAQLEVEAQNLEAEAEMLLAPGERFFPHSTQSKIAHKYAEAAVCAGNAGNTELAKDLWYRAHWAYRMAGDAENAAIADSWSR